MLIEERKKIILEKLKINSMVTLAELIDEIGASESTIRRDLQMLDKEGKLKKVQTEPGVRKRRGLALLCTTTGKMRKRAGKGPKNSRFTPFKSKKVS